MQYKFIALFIIILFITGCNPSAGSKNRTLHISFYVNKKEDIQPSYQLTIWLEKPDGAYVKTLFVCDYLSYGGFNDSTICPDWSGKANWSKVLKEEFDAVTGATPMIGNRNFAFNCSKEQIPAGKYKFLIEVHLIESFNELYSGEIEIAGKEDESEAQVTYLPEKHSKAGDILSQVKVKCNNEIN